MYNEMMDPLVIDLQAQAYRPQRSFTRMRHQSATTRFNPAEMLPRGPEIGCRCIDLRWAYIHTYSAYTLPAVPARGKVLGG